MPTNLPIGFSSVHRRHLATHNADETREFFYTLFLFYLGIGAMFLMLLLAEYELDAFRGYSIAQVALAATGTQFVEEIGQLAFLSSP